MPNSKTHVQIAKVAARLALDHGLAPSAVALLREGHADFFDAAALPDRVTDVECLIPGTGGRAIIGGKDLASLCHFQRNGRGYRFLDDDSLSVGAEAIAAAGAIAGARIVIGTKAIQPPLSGLIELSPFREALDRQPGFTIGTFLFPSAADGADYWFRSLVYWLRESKRDPQYLTLARRAAGMLAHFVADSGAPHHAWGVLLDGHQQFEDALEREATITLEDMESTQSWYLLAKSVAAEMDDFDTITVRDMCEEQALWAIRVFGPRHHLAECPGNVALRLIVRALAATIRGLEIATRAA